MAQTSYGTITISDMTDGASVVSTQQIYWLKTNSTAVVKRVDGTVLPGDNDITNGWTTIIPTYVIGGTYYISTATLLNRGTSPVYSEPVIDHVLTENSYNAAEAIRKANEQELIINGLQSKIKYIWTNLNAQDYAVGTYAASGIDQVELVYGNTNTYGFNSYLGHQDLRFSYNNIPLTTIGLEGLKLYSPLFTNNVITGSQVGIKLDRDGLYFYRPGTQIIDAQLDNNGLILRRGGITSGERGNNSFIYLSTQDFPLQEYQLTTDVAIDNTKTYYEINNNNYIEVEEPISSDLSNYYELIEAGITINNHTPAKADINIQKINNDIAWREIIGTKFGVDAEGNLYANNANLSNATVEGAIIATSLTIGSGASTYNAINAINASGYTIEIINDINAAPEELIIFDNTTYLYPIMYHNGVKVTGNEIIKTQFLWYEDSDNNGIQGDSENGGILASYGHTYRVTYSFDDGEVGQAPSIQQILVDPQKYITSISDAGIIIHPENWNQSSYIQLDGTGLELFDNNKSIAKFSENIRIGKDYEQGGSNEAHIVIDYHSLQLINKEQQTILHVSDLRNRDGIAELTNKYIGDGTTTQFILSPTAMNSDYTVLVDNVEVTEFSGKSQYQFSLTPAPAQNSVIKVTYQTTDSSAQAFTFGSRATGFSVGSQSAVIGVRCAATYGGTVAIGFENQANGHNTFVQGMNNETRGRGSHAEGQYTISDGLCSHSEGSRTRAARDFSHAEGYNTGAFGTYSHTEGNGTTTYGSYSHAEGQGTIASASFSHTEGYQTRTQGGYSHAEGDNTVAEGNFSHVTGDHTHAKGAYQTVIGRYNVTDTTSLFIIGKGDSTTRSNAFSVSNTGQVFVNGTSVHSSDRRLKTHISYIGDEAINFIDNLKPVHYIKDKEKHVGFYAQDVEKIDPWHCITGEINGYKTLGYMELIAPLVTYCQHLEKRISELEIKLERGLK